MTRDKRISSEAGRQRARRLAWRARKEIVTATCCCWGWRLPVSAVTSPTGLRGKQRPTTNVSASKSTLPWGRPAAELYSFWRKLENLPQVMSHLESVTQTGDTRSHWVAKAPLGRSVSWDAEITEDLENEMIAWRALEGSEIQNAGSVAFNESHDRGTEIKVVLAYEPPLGKVGATVARLLGEEPERQLQDDLRRFKQLMETGEIATVQGQPSGRA